MKQKSYLETINELERQAKAESKRK